MAAKREVNALAGDEIRLKFSDVHVQRTVENGEMPSRGDELREQAVQESVCWALDVQITAASVEQSHHRIRLVLSPQTQQHTTVKSVSSTKEGAHTIMLHGSTTAVAICGRVHMSIE